MSDQYRGGISRRAVLKCGFSSAAALGALCLAGQLPFFSRSFAKSPSGQMTMNAHPQTGARVSALGFGCMRLPMLPGATFPRGPEIDEKATAAMLNHALDNGVNYFDTAWFYHKGRSEPVIGAILARRPRESYQIATKMPTPLIDSLSKAKDIFAQQLERCHVDHFDFYQLHGIKSAADYRQKYEDSGVLDYLLAEKAQGRIRHLGWSFHGDPSCLEHLLAAPVKWDYAMLQLNYHDLLHKYNPSPQEVKAFKFPDQPAPTAWLYEQVRAAGIPIVVMEPLLGGRLARLGKKAAAALAAARPEWSQPAWAFRYVAGLPGVLTVLSGMTDMRQLQENIATFSSLENLSANDLAALQSALDIYTRYPRNRCTGCGYCMPCEYGVDIPAIFEHQNEHVENQAILADASAPGHPEARRAYLADYRQAVPDLRQASLCTGCGKCVKSCPAMIEIPDELYKIARQIETLRSGAVA